MKTDDTYDEIVRAALANHTELLFSRIKDLRPDIREKLSATARRISRTINAVNRTEKIMSDLKLGKDYDDDE